VLNKVLFSGRLTKDIELKQTKGDNGKIYAFFQLAVQRDFDRNNTVDFLDFRCWENIAKYLHKYAKKGSLILIKEASQWTSNYDGKKNTWNEVRQLDIIGFANDDESNDSDSNNGSSSQSEEDRPF